MCAYEMFCIRSKATIARTMKVVRNSPTPSMHLGELSVNNAHPDRDQLDLLVQNVTFS